MTSAVLVLKYMPDMCLNCLMTGYSNQGRPFCNASKKHLDTFVSKPDWCPLIEVPKRLSDADLYDEYETGYEHGWNSCLKTILGEQDE